MHAASFGPGGMPRSRQQQLDDDFALATDDYGAPAPRPPPRSGSAMSFGRRVSGSSVASGRTGMFGWGRRRTPGPEDVGDDGGFGDDDEGHAGDVPQMSMGDVTGLRDRDRYPSMAPGPTVSPGNSSPAPSGRTMSISSTMSGGGFDTTPIIPTMRPGRDSIQYQYRKNLTTARKQAIRNSDGVIYPPQGPPGQQGQQGQQGPPPAPQFGYGPGGPSGPGGPGVPGAPRPGYNMGPNRPPSMQRPYPPQGDARLRSISGYNNGHPNMDYGAPMGQPRTMSMTSQMMLSGGPPNAPNGLNGSLQAGPGGPGPHQPGPGPRQQRISRPPSRLSQSHPPNHPSVMVTASTMTDPVELPSPMLADSTPNSSKSSTSSSNTTVLSRDSVDGVSSKLSPATSGELAELRAMNKTLLDEVRLVTSELADSIRRELGVVESSDDTASLQSSTLNDESSDLVIDSRQRAQKLVLVERELDLERRKRMVAKQTYDSDDKVAEALHNAEMKIVELERDTAEKERLYRNEQREAKLLQESLTTMTNEYESQQLEMNQLQNGIVPELKSHVADLEVLTAAGNPIELLKQIEQLKVENKKLQGLVEENSTRGPVGEKIKAVESQRDALREALRSLRERNDHEIRQSTDRVRQLEAKLEKERVINNQMQRKIVQTRSASYSLVTSPGDRALSSSSSTGSLNGSASGSATAGLSSTLSAAGDSNIIPLPKRRGVGHVPGIIPPSVNFAGEGGSRPASPVSFEISHEPAWIDYVNSSKLPAGHSKYGSTYSVSPTGSNHANTPGSDYKNQYPASTGLSLPNGRSEQLPLSLATTSS